MTSQEIEIEKFVPVGYKNRVSRDYLARITRISDRNVRLAIEKSPVPIVNADGGYFIPGNSKEDREKAKIYVLQEQKRVRAIQCKLRKFKDFK